MKYKSNGEGSKDDRWRDWLTSEVWTDWTLHSFLTCMVMILAFVYRDRGNQRETCPVIFPPWSLNTQEGKTIKRLQIVMNSVVYAPLLSCDKRRMEKSVWTYICPSVRIFHLQNYLTDFDSYRDRLSGLVVIVSGYRSRGPGFDSRRFQIFWEAVDLEQGSLSLVRTTEELLGRNSSGSVQENRD
jgi:hypothetical protein